VGGGRCFVLFCFLIFWVFFFFFVFFFLVFVFLLGFLLVFPRSASSSFSHSPPVLVPLLFQSFAVACLPPDTSFIGSSPPQTSRFRLNGEQLQALIADLHRRRRRWPSRRAAQGTREARGPGKILPLYAGRGAARPVLVPSRTRTLAGEVPPAYEGVGPPGCQHTSPGVGWCRVGAFMINRQTTRRSKAAPTTDDLPQARAGPSRIAWAASAALHHAGRAARRLPARPGGITSIPPHVRPVRQKRKKKKKKKKKTTHKKPKTNSLLQPIFYFFRPSVPQIAVVNGALHFPAVPISPRSATNW